LSLHKIPIGLVLDEGYIPFAVVCGMPGYIDTDMVQNTGQNLWQQLFHKFAFGSRLLEPQGRTAILKEAIEASKLITALNFED
jgi:hypothetical protein